MLTPEREAEIRGWQPCPSRDELLPEIARLRAENEVLKRDLQNVPDLVAQLHKTQDENAALREALEHLANPSREVRATGQDARDMATFARGALARLREVAS